MKILKTLVPKCKSIGTIDKAFSDEVFSKNSAIVQNKYYSGDLVHRLPSESEAVQNQMYLILNLLTQIKNINNQDLSFINNQSKISQELIYQLDKQLSNLSNITNFSYEDINELKKSVGSLGNNNKNGEIEKIIIDVERVLKKNIRFRSSKEYNYHFPKNMMNDTFYQKKGNNDFFSNSIEKSTIKILKDINNSLLETVQTNNISYQISGSAQNVYGEKTFANVISQQYTHINNDLLLYDSNKTYSKSEQFFLNDRSSIFNNNAFRSVILKNLLVNILNDKTIKNRLSWSDAFESYYSFYYKRMMHQSIKSQNSHFNIHSHGLMKMHLPENIDMKEYYNIFMSMDKKTSNYSLNKIHKYNYVDADSRRDYYNDSLFSQYIHSHNHHQTFKEFIDKKAYNALEKVNEKIGVLLNTYETRNSEEFGDHLIRLSKLSYRIYTNSILYKEDKLVSNRTPKSEHNQVGVLNKYYGLNNKTILYKNFVGSDIGNYYSQYYSDNMNNRNAPLSGKENYHSYNKTYVNNNIIDFIKNYYDYLKIETDKKQLINRKLENIWINKSDSNEVYKAFYEFISKNMYHALEKIAIYTKILSSRSYRAAKAFNHNSPDLLYNDTNRRFIFGHFENRTAKVSSKYKKEDINISSEIYDTKDYHRKFSIINYHANGISDIEKESIGYYGKYRNNVEYSILYSHFMIYDKVLKRLMLSKDIFTKSIESSMLSWSSSKIHKKEASLLRDYNSQKEIVQKVIDSLKHIQTSENHFDILKENYKFSKRYTYINTNEIEKYNRDTVALNSFLNSTVSIIKKLYSGNQLLKENTVLVKGQTQNIESIIKTKKFKNIENIIDSQRNYNLGGTESDYNGKINLIPSNLILENMLILTKKSSLPTKYLKGLIVKSQDMFISKGFIEEKYEHRNMLINKNTIHSAEKPYNAYNHFAGNRKTDENSLKHTQALENYFDTVKEDYKLSNRYDYVNTNEIEKYRKHTAALSSFFNSTVSIIKKLYSGNQLLKENTVLLKGQTQSIESIIKTKKFKSIKNIINNQRNYNLRGTEFHDNGKINRTQSNLILENMLILTKKSSLSKKYLKGLIVKSEDVFTSKGFIEEKYEHKEVLINKNIIHSAEKLYNAYNHFVTNKKTDEKSEKKDISFIEYVETQNSMLKHSQKITEDNNSIIRTFEDLNIIYKVDKHNIEAEKKHEANNNEEKSEPLIEVKPIELKKDIDNKKENTAIDLDSIYEKIYDRIERRLRSEKRRYGL